MHHYIAETDSIEVLTELQKHVEELLSRDDKIIAYTSDGRALNQSQYKMEIDEAIQLAENGQVVSIEEMEKNL